jgi:hypothetical protein
VLPVEAKWSLRPGGNRCNFQLPFITENCGGIFSNWKLCLKELKKINYLAGSCQTNFISQVKWSVCSINHEQKNDPEFKLLRKIFLQKNEI